MKVQINLNDDLVKSIDDLAKKAGISRSSFISVCMMTGLNNMGFGYIVKQEHINWIDKKGGQEV